MALTRTIAADATGAFAGNGSFIRAICDILELTKTRIVGATVLAAAAGFAAGHGSLAAASLPLLGIALSAAGACALNMHREQDSDQLMERTCDRPLAAGRLSARFALILAVMLAASGVALLVAFANVLTASLSLFALTLYVGVYTPLKSRTPYAFVVGVLPGALPPLLGWTAATSRVSGEGLWLFGVLAAWQIPHVMALSTYLAEDYARASFCVFPANHGHGQTVAVGITGALLMLSLSLAPWWLGEEGNFYAVISAALGLWFTVHLMRGCEASRREAWGRRCFRASLVYFAVYFLTFLLARVI